MARVKKTIETGREGEANEDKDGKTTEREEDIRECKVGGEINKRGWEGYETSGWCKERGKVAGHIKWGLDQKLFAKYEDTKNLLNY